VRPKVPEWDKIGIFRNLLQTTDAPVRIFPDGTFTNQLKLYPYANSNSILGLNMKLPVDYKPDINSNSSLYK